MEGLHHRTDQPPIPIPDDVRRHILQHLFVHESPRLLKRQHRQASSYVDFLFQAHAVEQHRVISDIQIARNAAFVSTRRRIEQGVQLPRSRFEALPRQFVRARHQPADQVGKGRLAAMITDLHPKIVVVQERAHDRPKHGMRAQDAANRVHRRP